ncbi:hypothetical protein ABHI18_011375, partial [Aspergillus niger]
GAISPSAWAGNRLLMISNGRRTWRQYEPQYDLPSLRADSTPPNHVNQDIDTLPLTLGPYQQRHKLLGLAKKQARAATHEDAIPQAQVSRMKSSTLDLARSQAATTKALPEEV